MSSAWAIMQPVSPSRSTIWSAARHLMRSGRKVTRQAIQSSGSTSPDASTLHAGNSIMQPHILIIEDEPAQLEVLIYNLRSEGFQVSQAVDGDEGLLQIDENPPDVIILDWMLPGISGIEICRRLKS